MEFLNGGQLKRLFEARMEHLRRTQPHKQNPRDLAAQNLIKKKSKTKLKYYTGQAHNQRDKEANEQKEEAKKEQ